MASPSKPPLRREVLGYGAALVALGACGTTRDRKEESMDMVAKQAGGRMPTIYLPHGGGPWPWMPDQADAYKTLRAYTQSIIGSLPSAPKAVLMISAHWEEPMATVQSAALPPMLYDYGGFPPETYQIKWPAPGAPELAQQIEALLASNKLPTSHDDTRGFDHGTFVPMALMNPAASIPTLQLSLLRSLDPATHLRLGQALQPLRDQGVLIVGSGMSYHNMRGFMNFMSGGPAPTEPSRGFDEWLVQSMQGSPDDRARALTEWAKAPFARDCHPREEHLLPLHVVAGAALDGHAGFPFRDLVIGAHVSAIEFA